MATIKNERKLTAERLREVLHYDRDTGLFYWKETISPKAVKGSVAGMVRSNGYRVIVIDKEVHRAGRLAWLYVHGEFPTKLIDHISADKSDDRIDNLRLAEFAENSWNIGITRRNTSGFKGAYKSKWGWWSSIVVHGKRTHLGSFSSAPEAAAAYASAANRLHGEFVRVA